MFFSVRIGTAPPVALGELFILHKNRRPAKAVIFTHLLGWEVRLMIGAQSEVVQTHVCRTQEEVFTTGEQWKRRWPRRGGSDRLKRSWRFVRLRSRSDAERNAQRRAANGNRGFYVREPNADEQATGAVPLTQFGRMCASLGIQIIAASSPQAKGRVERNHGTHQDRLVKKLRRLGIANAPAANAFLETTYLPEHNRRFAQSPASAEDFHRRPPSSSRTRGCCPTTG